MPIQLSPMVEADMPSYVNVMKDAFAPHPRNPMMWPRGYTEDWYAYQIASMVDDLSDPNARSIKAVDTETNQIIAGAEWTFCLDPTALERPIKPDNGPPANWPVDGNWRMKYFFKVQWETWQREHLMGQRYLSTLSADPRACDSGADG